MTEARRILTDEEKRQVREKYDNRCYICELPLDGYEDNEIQYDHIYAHTLPGAREDIANFAPIHASANPAKRNCHSGKGKKTWFEYKEDLRIDSELKKVTGLADLCPGAKECAFRRVSETEIELNGRRLPLHNQRLNGKDNFYFFDEIELEYIENDTIIQLRPLEDKIYPLTLHLQRSIQLLPSLGRLDANEKKIKIFDGQHKAIAQIVGNRRRSIPCIIFLNPDVPELQKVVYDAHTKFLQQRYKRSHIIDKLAGQFKAKIEQWKGLHGDVPFSERDILQGETKASRRKFILASILDELSEQGSFIEGRYNFERDLVDTTKKKQLRRNPMLWDNYEKFVAMLSNLEAVEETYDSEKNFREEEIENIKQLLQLLYWYAVRNKWNPDLPESEGHQLATRFFYDKVFEVYGPILVRALRYSFEQKVDRALADGESLCYRERFPEELKDRFDRVFRRLFEHGMWANPAYRETFRATTAGPIAEVFQEEGLDYIFLTKPE